MHVLLADSPQNRAAVTPSPLRWQRLAYADLTDARRQVAEAAGIDLSSTAPAIELVGGMVGDELAGLTEADQKRAKKRARVFSAAYGVVGAYDRIAPHDLTPDTELPGIGRLGDFWAPRLAEVLPDDMLAIDARDDAYAALWRSDRTIAVSVQEGGRDLDATRERGRAARILLERPTSVRTGERLAAALVGEMGSLSYREPCTEIWVSPVGDRLPPGTWQAVNSGRQAPLRNLADVGRELHHLGSYGMWAYLVTHDEHGADYLQVGGNALALTVELREGERHLVLGRTDVDPSPRTVSVGGHDHVRHASEVFTADEAVPLVEAYARGEALPAMAERVLEL